MLPKIYIKSIAACLPQELNEAGGISEISHIMGKKLEIVAPNYAELIPPAQARRMSKLNKFSIFTGLKAIENCSVQVDAIITGTSKASKGDSEKFLRDMIQYQEEMLNPTPFILSTYNAVNGALALMIGCKGYNQTFVHKGSAFEWALLDAQLLLAQETEVKQVLVGGYDETTDDYYRIKDNLNYWKKELSSDTPWYAQNSQGTVPGEGAAYMVCDREPKGALAAIASVKMLQDATAEEVIIEAKHTLQQLGWDSLDAIILGFDGDIRHNDHYEEVANSVDNNVAVIQYKPLCGEFETSSSLGIWLVVQLLGAKKFPEQIFLRQGEKMSQNWKRILIYNSFMALNNNLIFLESSI